MISTDNTWRITEIIPSSGLSIHEVPPLPPCSSYQLFKFRIISEEFPWTEAKVKTNMVLLEVMADVLDILNAATAQKLSNIISDDGDSDWLDDEPKIVIKKKGKVVCSCPFKELENSFEYPVGNAGTATLRSISTFSNGFKRTSPQFTTYSSKLCKQNQFSISQVCYNVCIS